MKKIGRITAVTAAVMMLGLGMGTPAMALELNPDAKPDTSQIEDRRPKCHWYTPWIKKPSCR